MPMDTIKKIIQATLLICLLIPTIAKAQINSLQEDSLSILPAEKADSTEMKLIAPFPVTPTYSAAPFSMYGLSPFDYGYSTWELHKGFNASLGMSLSVGFGNWMPSGVGFGQDAAFMYAVPVNNRLSIAGGIYAHNMDWGFLSYKEVGISGVAAYRLTDRISIYAYGNKSLTPKKGVMYPAPAYFNSDRIGGMINFKLNESASISVGVEGRKGPAYGYWW